MSPKPFTHRDAVPYKPIDWTGLYPPAFPKGWDPKTIKVWVPKFDEFEKLRTAWLEDWNKTYGYRQ